MKNIPLALEIVLGLAIASVIAVVFFQQRESSQAAGWDALATAERAGATPEALETASQSARGTPAEAWVDFLLARKLFDAGGKDQLERARLIAQQALDRHPDAQVASCLSHLVAAIDSYAQLGSG